MTIIIENKKHECNLLDDGTLDTVIEIDNVEHRFSWSVGADIRNFDGSIIEPRFIDLCKMAIDNDERHW